MTTHRLKERLGNNLKKGELLAEVHQLQTVNAEIAVPEKEISEVQVGQRVVLKARAFPAQIFVGSVTAVAPAAVKEEERWRGKVVRVTTMIDNPGLLLKPEMTGQAKIYCGARSLFDLLTLRLARYLRVEFWSWW